MKSNVIKFPSREKESRDQVVEIKEALVLGGHFDSVKDVPSSLVLFILQYWQEIHDSGMAIGKTQALNMMLSSSSSLPMNKVEDLARCRLQNELIEHSRTNKIAPASLKSSWTTYYQDGVWRLDLKTEKK
ncbi:MAG: hypothetical protein OEU84_12035 [Xanthomonadales bacterium]|nr:hypothetical protein [Xanthomonadales bacterium]